MYWYINILRFGYVELVIESFKYNNNRFSLGGYLNITNFDAISKGFKIIMAPCTFFS